jgi:hypothetical protein
MWKAIASCSLTFVAMTVGVSLITPKSNRLPMGLIMEREWLHLVRTWDGIDSVWSDFKTGGSSDFPKLKSIIGRQKKSYREQER